MPKGAYRANRLSSEKTLTRKDAVDFVIHMAHYYIHGLGYVEGGCLRQVLFGSDMSDMAVGVALKLATAQSDAPAIGISSTMLNMTTEERWEVFGRCDEYLKEKNDV